MDKTDSMPSLVICDAGPLIHLDELGCLDLLGDFDRIIVPDTVCSEVDRHRPSVFSHPDVELQRMTAAKPVPAVLSSIARIFTLHAGEWEALRIALEFPSGIFLTDDTAARLAAGNLGIKVHGTIGILIRSIRRKQRTSEAILETLRKIPEVSTLHLKSSLLDAIILQVEATKS